MAFTEDLAQFFDPNFTAVPATFKTSAGATIRTAYVNFNDANGGIALFDNQVLAAMPSLQCRTADLLNVDNTCKVTIGATTYQIVEHSDDGTGTSVVQLRK